MSDPKGLGWDKEDAPALYALYAKKLPRRAWPGQLDKAERAYARRTRPQPPESNLRGVCLSVQTASGAKAVSETAPRAK